MSFLRYTPLVAVLFALGACESSTSSDPPVAPVPKTQVLLTGTPGEMWTRRESSLGLRAECVIPLVATASAKGSGVRWQGGRMLWHFGMSRTAPSDTMPIPEEQIVKGWGSPNIAAGATQKSAWTFYAGAPFKLTLEMSYLEEATGATGTATHTFTCGPTPPAGGAPVPVVRNVEFVLPAGDTAAARVVPGRFLTVTYEAESGSGVWESGVIVSGAFSARARDMTATTGAVAGTVRGKVDIWVPADAQIGQPVQVQAYALDAFMQPGVAGPATEVRLVSNKPPVLHSVHFTTWVPAQMDSSRLVGQFAAGETMRVRGDARESRGPGWLVYTLGGAVSVRDSVPVPNTNSFFEVSIPVKPGWVGATSFSVQIVNEERMYSGTASSPADSFRIVPTRELPLRSATVAATAYDVVLDESRGLLYLATPSTGRVEVLSLATLTSTPIQVTTNGDLRGVELTRGGDTLLAALAGEGALAVVDLSRPDAPAHKVRVTVNGEKLQVQSVRVAANGKVLVSGKSSDTYANVVVEMTSSGSGQRLRTDVRGAGAPGVVARSGDRGRLFYQDTNARCIIVYDSRTDEFGSCVPGQHPGTVSSTPTGSRFASGYDVFDANGGKVRSFPVITNTALEYTTAITPDGSHLYAGVMGGLARLRVSDGEYLELIPITDGVQGRILFAGPRRLIAVDTRVPSPGKATRIFVFDLP